MSIFFKNGSYIKTIKNTGEARRPPGTKVYLLKEGYEMTNLQKMFNGDLTAADKWVVDMANDSICSTCKIQSYCNEWNDRIYSENMSCMSAYLRWLLEEAVEEPQYHEVERPLQVKRVHMMCQCGGEFESTGVGLGSATSTLDSQCNDLYQHKCNKCGAVQDFGRFYPYVTYCEEAEAND